MYNYFPKTCKITLKKKKHFVDKAFQYVENQTWLTHLLLKKIKQALKLIQNCDFKRFFQNTLKIIFQRITLEMFFMAQTFFLIQKFKEYALKNTSLEIKLKEHLPITIKKVFQTYSFRRKEFTSKLNKLSSK